MAGRAPRRGRGRPHVAPGAAHDDDPDVAPALARGARSHRGGAASLPLPGIEGKIVVHWDRGAPSARERQVELRASGPGPSAHGARLRWPSSRTARPRGLRRPGARLRLGLRSRRSCRSAGRGAGPGARSTPTGALAAGLYISSWYSKSNSSMARLRSCTRRSNGDSNAVRPENGRLSSDGSTRHWPLTPSTTAGSPASPTPTGSTGRSGPLARAMPRTEPSLVTDAFRVLSGDDRVVGIHAHRQVPQSLASLPAGDRDLAPLHHEAEELLYVPLVGPPRRSPGHRAGVRQLAHRQRPSRLQPLEDVPPAGVVGFDPYPRSSTCQFSRSCPRPGQSAMSAR